MINEMPLHRAQKYMSDAEFAVISGLVEHLNSSKNPTKVRAMVSVHSSNRYGKHKQSVWVDLQWRGLSGSYKTNTTYRLRDGKIRCGPMAFEFNDPDSIERFYLFAARCWDTGLSEALGFNDATT